MLGSSLGREVDILNKNILMDVKAYSSSESLAVEATRRFLREFTNSASIDPPRLLHMPSFSSLRRNLSRTINVAQLPEGAHIRRDICGLIDLVECMVDNMDKITESPLGHPNNLGVCRLGDFFDSKVCPHSTFVLFGL